MRFSVSKAKVEKVVNPPHKPVFIKRTVFGESELFFTASAAIRPITKQPRRFITRVFTGKVNGSLRGIRPVRYLRQAPIPPPNATTKQFNILPYFATCMAMYILILTSLFLVLKILSK